MNKIAVLIMFLSLTSCMTKPNYAQIYGGQRMYAPGISFEVPANNTWSIMVQETYRTILVKLGNDEVITDIIAVSIFNIPKQESKESFLSFINSERDKEPQTGRFEIITENISLYNERAETCVKYNSSSKDFGAKRDNKYTLFETYNMYCIHPTNPNVGMFIELSRKAPIGNVNEVFEQIGEKLLKSTLFTDFKV